MTAPDRRRVVALVLVCTLSATAVATAMALGPATEDPTAVDACTTIERPGEYVLVDDVGANASGAACLTVRADGVTVDGDGFAVEPPEGTDARTGVLVEGRDAVVRDVRVSGWETGLGLVDADGTAVTNATVDANRDGVVLDRTADATVARSTLTGNARGVGAADSALTVTDSTVRENGVGVEAYLSTLTVERSSISANDGVGVGAEASGLTVDRTVLADNGGSGVRVVAPESATVRYSVLSGNAAGVVAEDGRVDARRNWWGAEGGPSGGLADPTTGRVADGAGGAVAGTVEEGIAAVRFDPYYVTDPREGEGRLVAERTERPGSTPDRTGTATDTATRAGTATPAGTVTSVDDGTGTAASTTTADDADAGPGAPLGGTEAGADTARVFGGETTTSGDGPGFGVLAGAVALLAGGLLARRR
jgi:PGF-CTERM protein